MIWEEQFKAREYYLKKWDYDIVNERNAISYWSWNEGDGQVNTPAKHSVNQL